MIGALPVVEDVTAVSVLETDLVPEIDTCATGAIPAIGPTEVLVAVDEPPPFDAVTLTLR